MKRILVLTFAVAVSLLSASIVGRAADNDQAQTPKKHTAKTEEQRKLRKEMLEKYDTNKDGKLDKKERAKISKEDQERMDKAGLGHHRKSTGDAEKKDAAK